jgi:two-component system, chemotaxis family, response regulator Rcp1
MNELSILLVEDNPGDVFFFREALKEAALPARLQVVTDGQQAMDFLHRSPPYLAAARPDVIVLDLNLPIKDGREVMQEMAADPALRTLPIAVLTTSMFEDTVCGTYPGPCLYFTKTDDLTRLQNIIRQISTHATPPTL